MDIIRDNITWMCINIVLAFIAVIFGWVFLKEKNKILKTVFFILWFLFIPNTIYIVTDLQYFPNQFFEADPIVKLLLLFQYSFIIFISVVTYLYGFYPFVKFLKIKLRKNREAANYIIVIMNFLIAFGVILGRIQRTNSWYVFSQPQRVISDGFSAYSSLAQMIYVIIFTVLINILYFGLRNRIPKVKV